MNISNFSSSIKNQYIILFYHIILLITLVLLFLFFEINIDLIFNYKMLIYPSYYKNLIYYFYGKYGFISFIAGITINIVYLLYSILYKILISKRILFIHALSPFYGSIIGYFLYKKIFLYYGFFGQICGFILFDYFQSYKYYIFILLNIIYLFIYIKLNLLIAIYQIIKKIIIKLKIVSILKFLFYNFFSWLCFFIPFLKNKFFKHHTSIESLIYKSLYKDFSVLAKLYNISEIPEKENNSIEETISFLYIKKINYPKLNINFNKILSKEDFLLLIDTLNYYEISTKFESACEGPYLHTVILTPDQHIKLNKIYNIEFDLGRILGKSDIRIIYPIKNYPHSIGFEYSHNKLIEIDFVTYLFNELFLSSSPLNIILGLDTYGELFYLDIEKAPHILLSGTTGSGKSSILHTIITSLLWKNKSSEVEIILIDPKKSEFFIFESFPHLKKPVCYTINEIEDAIDYLLEKMAERYELLNKKKCKNINEYNLEAIIKIPFIVVFIDEYADIIIQAKHLEIKILRLLQMSRAAGIHIIISTQRPSIEIITGTLKSNLPVRIACKVINTINSKIIIDAGGAEKLFGNGDMILFLDSKYIRVHGFYLKKEFIYQIEEILKMKKK